MIVAAINQHFHRSKLGQISALRVISRTSIMTYKHVRKLLPDIARELNIEAVVEGTVLRSGERVRITAQLIRVPVERYDADAPMSRATFNRVTYSVVELAKKEGLPLEPFTVHDLRRTGSTLLNELGFNSDWIEKCLAHEDGRSSRGVYNKAEYEVQRRHMMQEWSNIIDAWVAGQKYVPVLIPPSMPLLELDPALSPAESAVA
jgi:integrase